MLLTQHSLPSKTTLTYRANLENFLKLLRITSHIPRKSLWTTFTQINITTSMLQMDTFREPTIYMK